MWSHRLMLLNSRGSNFRGSRGTVFAWILAAVIAIFFWFGAFGEISTESGFPTLRNGPDLIDAIQPVASRPRASRSLR